MSRIRIFRGLRAITALLLVLPGCQEVIIACAADGTCPAGRTCVEGLCKSAAGSNVDGAAVTAEVSDGQGALGCAAAVTGGPSARSGSAGGVLSGRLLLLGGDDAPSTPCSHKGRTAKGAWQLSWCEGWSKVAGNLPQDRSDASSAAAVGGEAIALYGGRQRPAQGGNWLLFGDLWLRTNSEDWTRLATAGPPPRARAGLALAKTGEMFLHGGDAGTSDGFVVSLADTWRFDTDADKWLRIYPPGGPGKRYGHAVAMTRDDAYMILVGGRNDGTSAPLADTWRLDVQATTWQQIGSGLFGPSGRQGAGLIAIPGDPRLLFFGGRDSAIGARNDLWVLDPGAGSWVLTTGGDAGASGGTRLPRRAGDQPCTPPADFMAVDVGSPAARSNFVWGYEPKSARLWLAGGRGPCGPLRDAWSLHLPSVSWQPHEASEAGWSCPRRGGSCDQWCSES